MNHGEKEVSNPGYERGQVMYKLGKKGVKLVGNMLTVPRDTFNIGIKTWGMIDFLGYPWRKQK